MLQPTCYFLKRKYVLVSIATKEVEVIVVNKPLYDKVCCN